MFYYFFFFAIQILASLTVSLCSMVVGFASAYTSPALPSMNSPGSVLTVSEEEVSTYYTCLHSFDGVINTNIYVMCTVFWN